MGNCEVKTYRFRKNPVEKNLSINPTHRVENFGYFVNKIFDRFFYTYKAIFFYISTTFFILFNGGLMKKRCFLILGILLSISHAQLVVSETVYRQMDARENTHVLMKSQKIVLEDSHIYTITGSKNFKTDKNFKVKQFEDFYRFTLSNKKKKKRILASEGEMRKRALNDIKAILSKDVADSCAITSVGYEYEQRDSNKPRVVGSIVMAHRLLDGISVRGSSYVLMSYDSTGNLSYMDVQWDKYNKAPAKSTIGISKRNEIHRQEFKELVELISQDFKDNGLRGSLDNSVQTLILIENEKGKAMIVPGVTFIGQYSTDGSDENVPIAFDIPTDASLVPLSTAIVSR